MILAATIVATTRVIRRLRSARRKSTMNRGTRLRHPATTGAIRLHRAPNHIRHAAAAAHRHTAAEVRPPMVAAATAIRNHPRIPSTVSVLAPSLRVQRVNTE